MLEEKEPKIIELDIKKVAKAGFWSTIILSAALLLLNAFLHGKTGFEVHINFWNFTLFIICYFILIALHELFHLIGFIIFGKAKWSELDYGVNLKLGIAYATTSKPLPNHAMKKALLLPFWATGVLPSIFGFVLDSQLLVVLGAFLMAGAAGDFCMYKELRKYPKNVLVKDDPKLPKLYVYE
ncbi:DUF3267 domain-containing protein [Ureibacillus sp. FSL K6-8385]|uniref:DUF3267 domain-containing protein n=1 Tax=Ureibacillus terrenus TaxID=118246 RepID=A0A540V300_9BACL|nr:DUF3267 domain-containing protein [Ureibacillus terrenus]MED3661624.1 DUF3267 domain-containing protein [Ureibacillus terrenus]MED3763615.1 DUF3267 domain-containing protein [Ureibacillus terrenus]TQE91098.1 DUF3267 domain-containing protein [Ureibacillus terrenus]